MSTNNDGDEDDERLLLLLDEDLLDGDDDDGDVFVAAEERQRRAAAERRRQRRKRPRVPLFGGGDDGARVGPNAGRETTPLKDTPPTMTPPQPPAAAAAAAGDDDDDGAADDEFDMFSSSVSPVATAAAAAADPNGDHDHGGQQQQQRGHEQQDWDDAEGYYKAVIGETIHLNPSTTTTTSRSHGAPTAASTAAAAATHAAAAAAVGGGTAAPPPPPPEEEDEAAAAASIRVRVAGVIGKGVFSTVLKGTVISNSSSVALPVTVALKCIRHNETMAKAALTELEMLLRLSGSPGVVPLLLPLAATQSLEHRGHVILVFSFMEYNLRDVLLKFGKGVGLSLQAVRSYFGQLLAAATHLQKHGIVHADLKPDNILVSADFAVIQLADFGSAVDAAALALLPTPYLVSRFYRAPEIILGLLPTYAIDLWSLAVTVAELFLGDVLFRGTSNNDMLYVVQQHLGAFSNRVIRQHLVQSLRFLVPPHFQLKPGGNAYYFTQQTTDSVTGAPVHKVLSLVSDNGATKFPLGTPLPQKLNKAKSAKDARKMVQQFSDLLGKCLALDPTRRIALKEALRHDFFTTATAST